jgi:hypothetical protein
MRWPLIVLLAVVLLVVAAVAVAPTIERQRAYASLRQSGAVTTATIDYCATASNNRPSVVTVTCPGTFALGGTKVTEDILGLPHPLTGGSTVVVAVDPADPRVVYPVTDVRSGDQSGWWTGRTGVAALSLLLVALLAWRQVVVAKRRPTGSDPAEPGD